MGLIVDRVQAEPVAADRVFEVFGPYIVALLLVNAIGQACSKLQDWSVMQLEMNGNYHLARLCFDTLANQSMTFHTSRFGGSLVSQTSRFTGGYSALVDVVVYSLIPTIAAIVCTIVTLAPAAPVFVLILFALLILYVVVAYTMYQRILPLSAATASGTPMEWPPPSTSETVGFRIPAISSAIASPASTSPPAVLSRISRPLMSGLSSTAARSGRICSYLVVFVSSGSS
jgi:ABC-type multidrug transport system fused ATPase/permease subunit